MAAISSFVAAATLMSSIGSVVQAFRKPKAQAAPQAAPKALEPPKVEAPQEMPDLSGRQAQAKKTESIRRQSGRKGRASTIMTGRSETLG